MASGGVNVYYHMCSHGHDNGVFAFAERECHDDADHSHDCCTHGCSGKSCGDENAHDGCCTNHHEFISIVNDFIVEQELNITEPGYTETDLFFIVLVSVINIENSQITKISDPPDIPIFETGRDLICHLQNFQLGDCHIT